MKKQFVTACPACRDELTVSLLTCPSCGTRVEGDFSLPPLFDLAPEDHDFLMLFLKTWGNLSEMGKIMGVSYPTIRVRYEAFLKKAGIEPSYSKNSAMEILEQLDQGEIDAKEALKRIKGMR